MAIGAVQTGLTLGALMLEVAKEFGYARIVDDNGNDQAPTLPAEPSRLSALTDAVTGGYAAFLRANNKWSFLTPTIDIQMDTTGTGALNVAGDPGRYLLPVGVSGRPSDGWLLTLPSSSDQRTYQVMDTSSKRVATDRSQQSATGVPVYAAVRPMMQTDGSVRWEVYVSPSPDANYIMTAQLRLAPPDLTLLDDRHIAGPQHNDTIIQMAFAQMAQRDGDPLKIASYSQAADRSLAESVRLDGEMIEANLDVLPDVWDDDHETTRADVRRGGFPAVTYNGV